MEEFRGPIPTSNWIVKDVLLASSYPAKKDPDTIQRWMDTLMSSTDINMFVSLMEPKDREGLIPYEPYLINKIIDYRISSYVHQEYSERYKKILTFVNFPIVDRNVTTDENILALAAQLHGAIEGGYRILIHCKGGKGRTGTLMSVLLCKYYGFTADLALQRVYTSFNYRERKGRYKMSLTKVQQEQVHRVCPVQIPIDINTMMTP